MRLLEIEMGTHPELHPSIDTLKLLFGDGGGGGGGGGLPGGRGGFPPLFSIPSLCCMGCIVSTAFYFISLISRFLV